ncbi:hemicentin-1-like isoform X2 [Paramuricea clavata]|uniref:Hemicentin-1-like isoform X2 n=1 Tax=Paramuricea clavata TaxID=317549 RepID=A0A6S7H9U2_PARCT|nr:hemicentin-1-like isoform X2 [Paramuricea clavata]
MIVNYSVCISHEESKPCFKEQTTKEKMLVIASMNASTKYYVRVVASTKVGPGPYSESKGKFTNGDCFTKFHSEYYSTDWSPASKTVGDVLVPGGPRVLTKISSGDIKAKEGDLVNLLCSAQGELPNTFTWEEDQKSLKSFTETEKPHRSSFLVVTVKGQTSFGKYICHIQDRFQSTIHTISIQKATGNATFDLFNLHKFYKTKTNQNTIRFCFKI